MELQKIRNEYIEELDKSQNIKYFTNFNSKNLFNLGLSFYADNNDLDTIIYKSFSLSALDKDISLHEEQLEIIQKIKNNKGLIVSAPTSFGKTFCIFEYIARFKPKNVVLIVPTLALAREYILTFIKKYANSFLDYKIHTSIEDEIDYDFYNENNLFILTHEKASTVLNVNKIENLSFLVIDEVYKLDISMDDDRTLIFNIVYKRLAEKAEKYVLLAPFIKDVKNKEQLTYCPDFYSTKFSTVLNKVFTLNFSGENKNQFIDSVYIRYCKNEKTLIYFPSPREIEKYTNEILLQKEDVELSEEIKNFIQWAEKEIHPNWSVVNALKKGYLIHNGKIPLGIRNYLLSIFNESNNISCMLCTSTLLEGVNTTTKKLIIAKPNRISSSTKNGKAFLPFDFYNLVGRTGRFMKHFVGETYYIKEENDKEYNEKDANIEIAFELTEKTKDIDIQINEACNNPDVIKYLNGIGISIKEYTEAIGTPIRFDSFKKIRENFDANKEIMRNEMNSTFNLFKNLNHIVSLQKDTNRHGTVAAVALSGHKKIIDIYNEVKNYQSFKKSSIDEIIYEIFNIKNSYLEHAFLTRVNLVKLFLQKEGNNEDIINLINQKVINPIENMFYLNVPCKKMLRSIGIYETDIDIITNAIGNDFKDLTEMKKRLFNYKERYFPSISLVSKFAINSIL